MNKQLFMERLEKGLSGIQSDEKKEIIYDYNEHFTLGLEEGKAEEEISSALGDPYLIARQFKTETMIKQAETAKSPGNIFKAILSAIGLGFFNLIIVLGPFIAIVSVLFALFISSIALTGSGILAMFVAAFRPEYLHGISSGAAFFLFIGMSCLGLLFFIGNCYLARHLYNATLWYLKMNLSIIRKKEEIGGIS